MRIHFASRLRSAAPLAAAALVFAFLQVPGAASADTKPLDETNPDTPVSVAADPLPTVQINGVAWNQTIIGNTVYVAGNFTNARPAGAAAGVNTTPRSNLLAYDIRTGNLIASWAPTTNAQVLTITTSPDKSRIYIGGDFTTVNGVARQRIAAVNPTTGALLDWAPRSDSKVRAIAATNDTVYFGGLTTSVNAGIGGTARTRVGAVRASDGVLLDWAPNLQGGSLFSLAISPDRTKVLLGGSFTTVNGSSNPGYGLAAVDPSSAELLPWAGNSLIRNGGPDAAILNLRSDGDSVYVNGYVFGSGGNLEGVSRMSWEDGSIQWVQDCHGDTYDTFPKGDVVYVVSHAHYCGNLPDGFPQTEPWTQHYGTAFTKATRGTLGDVTLGYFNFGGNPSPALLKWLPLLSNGSFTGQGQAGWSVTGNDDYLSYGGEFPRAGNVGQQGLVRYATREKAPNKVGPEFTQSKFNPKVTSFAGGTARISWQANWDRDNENLTYKVIRNGNIGAPIYTTTLASSEWNRPGMGFMDTGLVPGQEYRYRVFASDPYGNEARSDTVTVTVSSDGDVSTYAEDVLSDGASSFWRLGEPSGSDVYDWAGFDDATAGSGVTRGTTGAISGDSNQASTFSGDGNGLAASTSPQTAPDTFTTEAWVKTTSNQGGKIVGFGANRTGNSGSYDRHVYMSNGGQITFGAYPGAARTVTGAKSYNDGEWHHVVAQMGSAGMALYVDGKKVGARSDTTTGQAYTGYWRIGGDNNGGWPNAGSSNYLNGSIDDVAVYPTVLTAAKIRQHFVDSGRTLAGAVAPADAYGKAVYDDEPDLYWRLGETSGDVAADSSPTDNPGNYNSGVTQGGASGVGASGDTSAAFNGSDGVVASANTFNNPTTYTEELWFKTTTNRGGKLIGFGSQRFGDSNNYDRHVYMTNDGKLRFGAYTGALNFADSTESYNNGAWHHMVATQSSGGMKLYVDGQLVGSNPNTGAQDYTGYWRIGGDTHWGPADSNYFDGSIDEVAVYSKALSASTVVDHFTKGGGELPNVAPTAAFTSSVDQLKVDFDGTGSTDSDGTVDTYEWTFGDGETGTGSKPNHTYATAGDKSVTLKVTDNKGATDSITKTVTAVAPPVDPGGPVASDTFGRTETNGWGTATAGGNWTRSGTASLFSVGSGAGSITMNAAGAGPRISLNSVATTDADATVKVALDKIANGGGAFVSVGARVVANNDYRAKVKVASDGRLTLYMTRVVAGAETTIDSVVLPTSLNYTVGSQIQIRIQAKGSGTTNLKAKVWKASTTEPTSWQVEKTDTTAALQAPGGISLVTYLAGSVTNGPVKALFDDLLVANTP